MVKPTRVGPLDGLALPPLNDDAVLSLAVAPVAGLWNLRLDPSQKPLMQALKPLVGGQALPTVPNTFRDAKGVRAVWLGPDEWLLASEDLSLESQINTALAGEFFSLVDVSHNLHALVLQGAAARQVLAKVIAMDLHPSVFSRGQSAGTLLALHTPVTLLCEAEDPLTFRIYVRRSFLMHVWSWLADAGLEFDIEQGRLDAVS